MVHVFLDFVKSTCLSSWDLDLQSTKRMHGSTPTKISATQGVSPITGTASNSLQQNILQYFGNFMKGILLLEQLQPNLTGFYPTR